VAVAVVVVAVKEDETVFDTGLWTGFPVILYKIIILLIIMK
jgi:hypothetical protein